MRNRWKRLNEKDEEPQNIAIPSYDKRGKKSIYREIEKGTLNVTKAYPLRRLVFVCRCVLDSRAGRGVPKMPVD